MRISIVTAYFNRWFQFKATLKRFNKLYGGRDDFELVVADDGSDDEQKLTKEKVAFCDFKVKILTLPQEKRHCCPCVPFNVAFQHVSGDIVLIQNPENTHYHNILDDVISLKDNEYRVYSCFSASPEQAEEIQKTSPELANIFEGNIKSASCDGSFDSWYQHSTIRNHMMHFCSAIKRKDLMDLEGFDLRFSTGVGYDDCDLRDRIFMKGMNVTLSNLVVYHQYHAPMCGQQSFQPAVLHAIHNPI